MRPRIMAPPAATTILRVAERHLGLLSIVAPMLDEEGTARAFCERVRSALDGLPWELVVVDDGSSDATPQILARARPRRRAHQGRHAVAQLRPPDGDHRRPGPRGGRRRRDDRLRPPGPAR